MHARGVHVLTVVVSEYRGEVFVVPDHRHGAAETGGAAGHGSRPAAAVVHARLIHEERR